MLILLDPRHRDPAVPAHGEIEFDRHQIRRREPQARAAESVEHARAVAA